MRAGVLSFASPKESSQRKGDPKVGALRVPCATRQAGRLAKLACGSDNASRLPPASLRCSAPLMGTRKTSRNQATVHRIDFHGQPEKKPKNEIHWFSTDALPGSLRGAEQRRKAGGSRRGLFEGQSPEFRSRPAFRVAQGTGQRPAPPSGSPFLWLLSFGEAKESTPANKAETQA